MLSIIMKKEIREKAMYRDVKIAVIIICSLIIALAVIGCVFSILNALYYDEIAISHSSDTAWLESEESELCYLMIDVHEIQFMHSLLISICSIALMTAVLCWTRLNNESSYPKLFAVPANRGLMFKGKFMNKTMLKIQIPTEIVCLFIGIACYLILQFVKITSDLLVLFAILLLPEAVTLIAIPFNIFALKWQYTKSKNEMTNLNSKNF